MAVTKLREKLGARTQPDLPGEEIQQVFMAQAVNPWWAVVTFWILLFGKKYRIIAVTDQRIAIFQAKTLTPSKPAALIASLPLGTQIGPLFGLWGQTSLNGERLWVHKRFFGDVELADATSPTA